MQEAMEEVYFVDVFQKYYSTTAIDNIRLWCENKNVALLTQTILRKANAMFLHIDARQYFIFLQW